MLKENKKRILITLGVIWCILGVYLISYNYLNSKIDKAYNNMNLQIFALSEEVENKEAETTNDNKEENKNDETNNSIVSGNNQNTQNKEPTKENNDNNNKNNAVKKEQKVDIYEKYYVAKLKIPKINLEKGLVDINSKYNTVSKNIQIIKGSTYPNVEAGNLILASHAGTNSVSYFRNLYKLSKGDKCYVNYKGKTYTYKIVNIYYQEKDGTIGIYRDYTKTTLTLVTCTKNSKTKQTIYIAELIQVK